MTTYEAFVHGAALARKCAHEWRVTAAKAAREEQQERYINEARKADERAEWYEAHAELYRKQRLENAA